MLCVPSIEHSEGTPLGLMRDERRREHDERNRSNERAERGLKRKLDHLDSTQFYSSPHKTRVPRNEQKNRINERAGVMSGWTIHRTPLPSWNSRKGRQVVLCCACWVDRSLLFCLCSSNPQLIQSVHPRPLSSHSNAWPCALHYCSLDDMYESIKSAQPQRAKPLISIVCMCTLPRRKQSSLPCSSSFNAFLAASKARNGCRRSTSICVPWEKLSAREEKRESANWMTKIQLDLMC